MKNFASTSFRLREASLEIRLIYSLFLVFIFAGLVTTWVLQFQRIGFGYEPITAYYLGGERAGQISFAKNFNVLLEEAHFHTFMMSAVFLILSHLFVATSVSRGIKWFFILLIFFSSFFDIGTVWLIRYVSAAFAYLLMGAWIGLGVGYLGMIFVPLYDMWCRRD